MKEQTKLLAMYVFAATVLTALIISTYISGQGDEAVFREEMRAFFREGPRNTANQGYDLCLRIQHLEVEHHAKSHPRTCADIYRIDK